MEFADHPDDGLHILDRRGGDDAMAKVEDVAGTSGGGTQNGFDAFLNDIERRKECDGVEVALDCVAVADGTPAFVEGLPPVEADDIGTGGSHGAEEAGGFDAEVNHWDAESLHGAHEALGSFKRVLVVVGEGERTDPAVEDLDDIGAGLYLKAAILNEDGDQLVEQRVPRKRIVVHHLLGEDVIARTAALDHVAGKGEWRSAKSDDAEAIAEVCGDFLDGAGDVGKIFGLVSTQGEDVGGSANGMMDYRSLACLELERQAHWLKRQEQVSKDDGGIDAEFFGGSDGDFGGDLRLLADFDQSVMFADVAVLLHVAAGLTEEPDGRAVYGFAEAGADEARALEQAVLLRRWDLRCRHTKTILMVGNHRLECRRALDFGEIDKAAEGFARRCASAQFHRFTVSQPGETGGRRIVSGVDRVGGAGRTIDPIEFYWPEFVI